MGVAKSGVFHNLSYVGVFNFFSILDKIFKAQSEMEKIRTILGLVMIIILVFMTNRLDKKHFEEVQETIISIHYDRVVAQDYLFQLTNLVQEDHRKVLKGELNSIDQSGETKALLDQYAETTLTKRESEVFGRLKDNIDLVSSPNNIEPGASSEAIFARIDQNLKELAGIQVKESKTLKISAQDSLDSNNLMSNMEMILIILFGIILQFVLFSGGKKKVKE